MTCIILEKQLNNMNQLIPVTESSRSNANAMYILETYFHILFHYFECVCTCKTSKRLLAFWLQALWDCYVAEELSGQANQRTRWKILLRRRREEKTIWPGWQHLGSGNANLKIFALPCTPSFTSISLSSPYILVVKVLEMWWELFHRELRDQYSRWKYLNAQPR